MRDDENDGGANILMAILTAGILILIANCENRKEKYKNETAPGNTVVIYESWERNPYKLDTLKILDKRKDYLKVESKDSVFTIEANQIVDLHYKTLP